MKVVLSKRLNILVFLLLINNIITLSQDTTQTLNKKRLSLVIGTELVGYTGAMTGLGTIWYNEFSNFHLFNDNSEWFYMDKLGHLTTAHYVGVRGIEVLKWAGVKEKKAIWYGGTLGLMFLTSVEIFDGFSKDWGFSLGDVAANFGGAALTIGQELTWDEQRILLKYSYHNSKYAKYRPELLGDSWNERWLKDYNGQTFWLSVNIKSFLNSFRLPDWLNVSVGYGIDGFVGAESNPSFNKQGIAIPEFKRYNKWYFSPDIDFTRIKTKSVFLKRFFHLLNLLKFPAPAIEYNCVDKFRFHWLFF